MTFERQLFIRAIGKLSDGFTAAGQSNATVIGSVFNCWKVKVLEVDNFVSTVVTLQLAGCKRANQKVVKKRLP